jgi:site-specific DNA-methyltransferase (adenine-specific)
MKKHVARNTLSFSCSKSMRYLRTPKDIWESLSREFRFSIDACASDANHLLPRYWTQHDDGLQHDWTGERVYCHPMFDFRIAKWVEKAYSSRCVTVLLLPAATHTRYFHRYIYRNPRCEIRFLEKPKRGFRFGPDDGTDDDPDRLGYIRPLMIVVFRNNGPIFPPRSITHGERETSARPRRDDTPEEATSGSASRFMSLTSLAATVGVSRATVRDWMLSSDLKTVRRQLLVLRDEQRGTG